MMPGASLMLIKESHWLRDQLARIPDEHLFPLLDVGSQTLEFRTTLQPHVDREIFGPLRRRGGQIIHLDLQDDPGVDLVGDLLDPVFRQRVLGLRIKSALVLNLLEHVKDRRAVADAVLAVTPPGGYLIVSGPKNFPYHADPLDTMFRPDIAQVQAYFPGTSLEAAALIDAGNWRQWDVQERGRSLGRTLLRLLTPFYRARTWWALARQSPYLFRHATAYAAVFRKQ